MLGILIGLSLCVSIWQISTQPEPLTISVIYSPPAVSAALISNGGSGAANPSPMTAGSSSTSTTNTIITTNTIRTATSVAAGLNTSTNQSDNFIPSVSSSTPTAIHLDQLAANDYAQLIDLYNFDFIINQKPCTNATTAATVLYLIHSAPANQRKRNVIRDTWGQSNPHHRVMFLLGAVNSTALQHDIERENRAHSDIVQGNFIDAYRNMTYKHVMALKWLTYFCSDIRYLVKTDDDVFVHAPKLNELLLVNATMPSRQLLFCAAQKNAKVSRSYRSKWRVSVSEYPGHTYPIYCPGFSIVYSADTVFRLYQEAQRLPYFWIDDVHVTGTLTTATGISITPLGEYFVKSSRVYGGRYDSGKFIFTTPNLIEREIRHLWKMATEPAVASSAASTTTTPRSYGGFYTFINGFKITVATCVLYIFFY